MLRSMTGFGSGDAALGQARLVVEARAVNHRFLDVRVRLPSELSDHATVAEDVARRTLERGRVEITGRVEGRALGAPVLDVDRARAAYEQLVALRDELRPDDPVPLSLLATVPDLFTGSRGPDADEARRAIEVATRAACDALAAMRAREGAALHEDLRKRLDRFQQHLALVEQRCPELVESYRKKLRERIERLLESTSVTPDTSRLEHEVALFADRADVAEEVTRLASHCTQFRELLDTGGEAVGRRLDFLLQEMGRETNTIGSKNADVDVARLVVELKADLERMREQVQNVL